MELVLLILIVILIYMIIKTIKEANEKRSKSSFDIKMYNDKVSIELISKYTGLTKKDINWGTFVPFSVNKKH